MKKVTLPEKMSSTKVHTNDLGEAFDYIDQKLIQLQAKLNEIITYLSQKEEQERKND